MRTSSLRPRPGWRAPGAAIRVLLLQGVDLLRGEGLGDPTAGEPGDGDAEPRGDHGPGVRAVAPQLLEPRGRIGLQGGQLGATTPSWNSAGVASVHASFFAAVAGFMVWVVWCDVMRQGYRACARPPTTTDSLAR